MTEAVKSYGRRYRMSFGQMSPRPSMHWTGFGVSGWKRRPWSFPLARFRPAAFGTQRGRSETSIGFAGGSGFVGGFGLARSFLNQSSSSLPQPSSPAHGGSLSHARRAAGRAIQADMEMVVVPVPRPDLLQPSPVRSGGFAKRLLHRRMHEDARHFRIGCRAAQQLDLRFGPHGIIDGERCRVHHT